MALKFFAPVQSVAPAKPRHPILVDIQKFPTEKSWGFSAQEQETWDYFVECLEKSEPAPPTMVLKNLDRKWELVSAFQKAIRRADKTVAYRLLSAMFSQPGEWAYWCKRIQVIAAEDIGPGNRLLTIFVCVAMAQCTPGRGKDILDKVYTGLTDLLLSSSKSRVYCSMSIIEGHYKYVNPLFREQLSDPELGWLNETLFRAEPPSPLEDWCTASNWRGDGMLKYAGMPSVTSKCMSMKCMAYNPLPQEVMFGLPEYAYDVHTRSGQQALSRLSWEDDCKKMLVDLPTPNRITVMGGPKKLLGWALFYLEGCLINGELADPALSMLEHKVIADVHGLSLESWNTVLALVSSKLTTGRMTACRWNVLMKTYG